MTLKELFLEQLDKEAASIRRTLERVPEGRNDWKPHEKSMTLGYLAALVATMLGWIDLMINRDELDLSAPDSGRFRAQPAGSNRDLIAAFEEALARGRAALEGCDDAKLTGERWRFMMAGQPVSEEPRYVMIRDSVFSHLAHHRGQLTVYLRLNEAPVPAIYGPSADERF
jgi:uncharacterized damage-inducible protein DinB